MSALSTGIGETLRAARRRQGQTLADIAASTKARETHLAALETEDFDALGGDVYVRGFISAYARHVGLDPEPLLAAYREHHDGQSPARRDRQSRPSEPRGLRVRSGRVAVLLLLVLVVALALVIVGLGDGGAATGPASAPWR